MTPFELFGTALLLPFGVALALGGRGRLALGLAFALAGVGLAGWPGWPPSGATQRLPLLTPLALVVVGPLSGALSTLTLGALSLQLALENGTGVVASFVLTALLLGGALLGRSADAKRRGLAPALALGGALLLGASGSITLGELGLALAAALAGIALRKGKAEPSAGALSLVLLAMGALLSDLNPLSAVLAGLAWLTRDRAPRALTLMGAALGLQLTLELLVPEIATAG